MRRRYICTDTMTGIFSAVYDAWRTDRTDTEAGIPLWGFVQHEMFCEYYEVRESEQKAAAVRKLIREHLGMEAYEKLSMAVLADAVDKGTAVLRTMIEARKLGDGHRIMEHLSHPAVRRVFELSRAVGKEAHAWKEFLRFRELKGGILYAEITPKNQVLPVIAEHFADRFPQEDFVIYDSIHSSCLMHPKRQRWLLVTDQERKWQRIRELSEEEAEWEKLWRGFRESISIKEREDKHLQRQNMPLRYRENMPEYGGGKNGECERNFPSNIDKII